MNKITLKIIGLLCFFLLTEITFAEAPKALISIQKGTLEGTIPFSLNLDGSTSSDPENGKLTYFWEYPDGKTFDSKNPRSHRFETPGTYEIKLTVTDTEGLTNSSSLQITANPKPAKDKKTKTSSSKKSSKYQNGDLSSQINFAAVFPNPSGADKDQEFITLYNKSGQNINLGNWQIQLITEKSTSTIKLSDQLNIAAKSELVLKNPDLKRSLTNGKTTLKLLDFNDQPIDRISYKDALENQVLTEIQILNWQTKQKIKTTLIWLKPDDKLEDFFEVNGKITEINDNEFILQTTDNKNLNLNLTDQDISQNILKLDSEIAAIIAKIGSDYQLITYKINSSQTLPTNLAKVENQKSTNFLLVSTLLISIILGLLITLARASRYK